MADAAETLRQAFSGLTVEALVPEPFQVQSHGSAALTVEGRAGLQSPVAYLREVQALNQVVEGRALEPFHAEMQAESGWARWGAEAEVIRMTPLVGGMAARMAVPPLPRKAQVLGRLEPPARPVIRRWAEPIAPPSSRHMEPGLGTTGTRFGMQIMLSLAVPIRSEDIQRLPKGLWMRYSLQLVRGTGENVRNLEVIGLFRLPRKGVADLRHDPEHSRILVRLEPSALKAARAPFILARKKDDGSLLSCFVEDP